MNGTDAWHLTGSDDYQNYVVAAAHREGREPAATAARGHGVAGRFREAHSPSDERLRLFDRLPRHDPRIGPEIIDTLHVVPLVAVAAGDLPRAVTAARRAWEDPPQRPLHEGQ
ncbi:Methionine--tRNA ligase [Streptomyces xiamenensis]|uniref:Methionine--tRNA ligase n=1 Tax=Streptomyces xiamenensis TaxID=408015 RepID=A0A0F7G138_9ACTN|nr:MULTISPECIES: hypothetical protein [Streptomyces]AKG46798.1 Methionine--tRNA ligase [Streptomyces xiamenensis]